MKTAKEMLKEYERDKDEIEIVNLKFRNFNAKGNREIEKIRDKFSKKTERLEDRIDKIEEVENAKVRKIKVRIEHKENTKKRINDIINGKIMKFERTIELLKLKVEGDLAIGDDAVSFYSYYRERHLKWADGYLFDDKFLKIRLLVCENGNRVNRYSIIAIGKTVFHKYLGNNLYQYGTDLKTDNLQLVIVVRNFPTAKIAEKWMERRKKHILSDIIYRYNKLKAEYMKIIKKYRDNDNLLELIEAKEMAEKL
jgi:hypothetical protein